MVTSVIHFGLYINSRSAQAGEGAGHRAEGRRQSGGLILKGQVDGGLGVEGRRVEERQRGNPSA